MSNSTHIERMENPEKLSLKSRMDIFSILGLLLILNIGCVVALQAEELPAPAAQVSEQLPESTLVIKVTETDILLGGRSVYRVNEAMATPAQTIEALANALTVAAGVTPTSFEDDHSNGRPVVITGDRRTPYSLFKRIMDTCDEADYWNVSLALNSVPDTSEELTVAGINW